MRQEKFTEMAWDAIIASQQLVAQFSHGLWDVEHILYAFLAQEKGIVPKFCMTLTSMSMP